MKMVKCGVQEAANFLPPNHYEHARFAMAAPILTQDYLKSILHYNPDTGVFINKAKRSNLSVGAVLGNKHHTGYLRATINRKSHLLHRLAFLYMTGEMPIQVDHINHKKDDNSWANLREADSRINHKNLPISIANKSGVIGVTWLARTKKWKSRIKVDGNEKHLGYFSALAEAARARKEAEFLYGFHNNHGMQRQPIEVQS